MFLHHPAFDHPVIHRDFHVSRVRIVKEADVDETVGALRFLFPYESVLVTPLGCCHRCVYTSEAPASAIGDRILEHLREIEYREA